MTERSPLVASFRREALEILARRNQPGVKVPVRNGRVVLERLAHGYRLDVLGLDQYGKPLRLATSHFDHLDHARAIGARMGRTMCVVFQDKTKSAGR
ncbi:hypothetical protein GGQ88_003518 [Novosphingobium hassiacum]|uniref:Uncharacterized protein n=1 Tax=Novosphingobium hassiacum TaxID=173676 RepID=A0A7W6EXM0_9SPHN|nr:hypothetical protein [Novosphingobium hassiacum]MBB3862220.1 hypothetical protein [Novosphingobium hassiacum]